MASIEELSLSDKQDAVVETGELASVQVRFFPSLACVGCCSFDARTRDWRRSRGNWDRGWESSG